MENSFFNKKRSQTEVIVTVILILVGITAVVIVSGFVINLVRSNLKGTECFDAMGSLKIDTENTKTNISTLEVSIERDMKAFNLTSITIVFGNQASSKSIKLSQTTITNVQYYELNGSLNNKIVLPEAGETKTYVINISAYGLNVTKVSISPSVNKVDCDKSDEKTL